jgi:peptidyl-prolyl cis-trans isomerase C|tara:strand:- start:233 stop:1084 length:852 start_codon:yes stop_codon:yes gene_type:complete
MYFRKIISLILSLTLISIIFIKSAQTQDIPIVANVNKEKISLETMIHAMNELPPEIQSQPFMSYYEELLERVIDIKLIAQEGKKINLEEEPSVKAAIDFVTEKVLMQAFLSKYVQKNISEESVKASYNNYIADEISREEIKASHILLDTQNEAVEVIKMLNNGDDFAEVAKNKSTGPSGPSGGDLGWFKRGQMVPPFENAAFSLGQNEISQKPIQTQFGWHVIKVFEKRIPQAPSYENMKNNLIQDLERKIVSKKIQDLRNNALIEKLSSSELEPLLNLPSIQ